LHLNLLEQASLIAQRAALRDVPESGFAPRILTQSEFDAAKSTALDHRGATLGARG